MPSNEIPDLPLKPSSRATPRNVAVLVVITLVVILYIAVQIWAKDLYEAYPVEVSTALGVILSLGLVCLLLFAKKPYGQPKTQVIADKLGWVPDPRFRRKALSVLPEEDEIRAWQNLRVGLSLRDASHTQHGRDLGEVRLTVQLADPSASARARSRTSSLSSSS